MKHLALPKKAKKIYQKIEASEYFNVLLLFSLLLGITATVFIIGYISGFNQSRYTDSLTITPTPSITPIHFSVGFSITPYPPDESNWTTFKGTTHYHAYTLKLPSDYSLQSSRDAVNIYQDSNGNTVTISPSPSYMPVSRADYTSGQFPLSYTSTYHKGIETDKADIDLEDENLYVTYKGTPPKDYHFITIPTQMNITTYVISGATDNPYDIKVLDTDLFSTAYAGYFYTDMVYANTTNCHNQKASDVVFIVDGFNIIMDMNNCDKQIAKPITKASEIIINNKKYVAASFPNGNICLLSEDTPALRSLIYYPIKDWPFAPMDTTIHGMQSRLCIIPTKGILGPANTSIALKDLSYMIANMSFHDSN